MVAGFGADSARALKNPCLQDVGWKRLFPFQAGEEGSIPFTRSILRAVISVTALFLSVASVVFVAFSYSLKGVSSTVISQMDQKRCRGFVSTSFTYRV